MAIFARVVELDSFTRAAQSLGMTPSAVSQHVSRLERSLGVALLHRTTRRLSLTEAGAAYHAGCLRVVEAAREAEQQIAELRDELSGTLRVATTTDLAGGILAPLLAEFAARHPRLAFQVLADDAVIDLVRERVDVAIRVGNWRESTLVARRLAVVPDLLCAAPGYLARAGTPATPEDLTRHSWLSLTLLPDPNRLRLSAPGGGRAEIALTTRFATNSSGTLKAWMMAGLGIGRIVYYMVADELRAGALVSVLPGHRLGDVGIYALTQRRSGLPLKVRRFVGDLGNHFARLQAEADSLPRH